MEVAGGKTQEGVVIGNTYDKYGSRNPIVKLLMGGFDATLSSLVAKASPATIHEVGCGEGYWVFKWRSEGIDARGTDFSSDVIEMARAQARERGMSQDTFQVRSIYDLQPGRDGADLIVCSEVLEHVEQPRAALEALRGVVEGHLILSVPREPIWRVLNLARGKYIADLGNTPGHLQHWSTRSFLAMVEQYFDVQDVRQPLPWTMLLCRPKSK